jgi:hypothetical protein
MNIAISVALLQAQLFFIYDLVAKKLREQGCTTTQLVFVQGKAWPLATALFLLCLFFDHQGLTELMAFRTLTTLGFFVLLSATFQYLYFRCQRMAHSLTVISVLRNAISFPLLLLTGFLINGDRPTSTSFLAVGLLIVAAFLRPSRGTQSKDQILDKPFTIIGLCLAFVAFVTIKDPIYRAYLLLLHAHPAVAISAYMALSCGWWRVSTLKTSLPEAFQNPTSSIKLLYLLPALWICATIPEALAFRALPVFNMVAVGSITWILTLFSDIYYKRLGLNFSTLVFSTLVLTSVILMSLQSIQRGF